MSNYYSINCFLKVEEQNFMILKNLEIGYLKNYRNKILQVRLILIFTRQVNVLVKNAGKLVKKMIYMEIHIQYIYVEIVLMNYGKE